MVRLLTLALILAFTPVVSADEDFARFVNPFVGTAEHGHTFPGATVPFGMVQLSPDTRTDGWDAASLYHDSDRDIIGFSHTHQRLATGHRKRSIHTDIKERPQWR